MLARFLALLKMVWPAAYEIFIYHATLSGSQASWDSTVAL